MTRRLLGVDSGRLREGPARWNQYFYAGTPAAVGLPFEELAVPTDLGDMPAWFVPAGARRPAARHLGDPRARPRCHA